MRRAEPVPFDFSWRDLGALLTSAMLMSGMVIAWVKWRLAGDFASKSDIVSIGDRVRAMEATLATMPSQADVDGLADRMRAVEREVSGTGAEVRGLRDGMSRIEHDVRLLVSHQLKSGG